MFEPVSSRVNFPELELRVIQFWKDNRIFERSVEERDPDNVFLLYEGPPTANASPGVHHVLSRVFKDVIPRYKTMKGYRVPRKAGWDTHGLPVELSIEKELGFKSKDDIEDYGVARFNQRCRESVFRYVEEWNRLTERIGYWVDMDHPYVTLTNDYIQCCWWIIRQLWDRGLVYQGYRVTPHCPRCGTSLSSHEVALGYEENTPDPSVYIKFKIDAASIATTPLKAVFENVDLAKKTAYLLAWTTTPWTLPGNTALAIKPDAEYSVMESDADYLIMASRLVPVLGLEGYSDVARVAGTDIAGTRYDPLFNPHKFDIERRRFDQRGTLVLQEPQDDLKYSAIAADFVSLEDGTGIVHIAPSFGEDDYGVGIEEGLDFVRDYVDLKGVIQGTYPFAGKFVKDADPLILDDLKSRGLLYRSETIRHTYPFCWRCATPLLYYAKPSWYIRTTAKKDRLISGNEEINWYPEHIKRGRFGDWLENNVDWAFSRERYWGTPLPVWRCEGCGSDVCIGSIDELKGKLSGESDERFLTDEKTGKTLDLHRPFIDRVVFRCDKCGGQARRVPDVLDAWFDSGAMPVASWGHDCHGTSVEQARALLERNRQFPADYICEAVDQTRGWFYTLHAISILLFDQPCYRNVICLGHILDAEGEKMSKSRGNVVQPSEVIERHGADALRWYLLTSSPAGNPRRFSAELVGESQRRFLSTLWNVYSFFVTYANIDKFQPGAATDVPIEAELDRWITSDLNQLIADVTQNLEGYNPTDAGRRIEEFVDGLSNWYVRRSRRRFWKSESDADKLSAYATLYECVATLARLMAPFTPFIAEEMYRNLVRLHDPRSPDSVHLAEFPTADMSKIDQRLTEDIHLAMKLCSLGRAARSKAGIKVRQPLSRVIVKARSSGEREGLQRVRAQILEELNVKDVEFIDSPEALAGKPSLAISEEGDYFIAIDTAVTPELADEGLAREIVHRLQTMRKNAGFDIADYITTYYKRSDTIDRVLQTWAGYIKQETLSRELVDGIPAEAHTEAHKIGGEKMELGVRRIS